MNDFFRPPRVIEPKPLRDYQIDGINRIFEVMRAGQKPVYQLATGGGKGRMIAELFRLAHAKGRRAAVVVPWLSLIKQTWEVLANEGLPEELMSVEQGDHPLCDRRKPYQICSTDTLVRRKTLPQVDLVIFDEVHHHSMLYARWMAEAPHIKFLGVTATPWAKGMHETWDCLLIGETISSLIARGFLSPFRAFAPSQPDLSEVKITAGDYNEGQLSKVMQKPMLIADVVNTWLDKGEGRPTFGFGVDCAHAQALQARFQQAGVPCGYIDAYTEVEGPGGREDQLAQLARQDLKVIMNVGTLTTGVDAPFVSCLSLARPTKSEMLIVQIAGRVLRTHPGKKDALMFDHGSTFQSLGTPDEIFYEDFIRDDRPDKDAKKRKERLPKPCPVCTYLLAPGTRVCPSCGHERKPVSSVVCEEGELVEIGVGKKKKTKEAADHDTKQRWFSGLLYIARERGYKDGWAANKYREKFEGWPRGLSDQSAFPDAAISSWVKASQIRWAKRREKDANQPMENEQ